MRSCVLNNAIRCQWTDIEPQLILQTGPQLGHPRYWFPLESQADVKMAGYQHDLLNTFRSIASSKPSSSSSSSAGQEVAISLETASSKPSSSSSSSAKAEGAMGRSGRSDRLLPHRSQRLPTRCRCPPDRNRWPPRATRSCRRKSLPRRWARPPRNRCRRRYPSRPSSLPGEGSRPSAD